MTSHKTFKRAAGLMLVAVLASRLLGLVREMLIARQFGNTGPVSAYTSAFNLPDLLYFFLSSGALSSAFIPEFTKRFQTGKKREAWEVFSIIACFMGIVLTVAVVIFWIYAKPLVSILAVPGFVTKHPELVPLTMLLTRIILPCQLFFFVGGLMSATLESRQKFAARAAGPVIYNLGIIFGAVVLARWFNIAGVALGTLIGAFVGNIAYAAYCMRKEGYEFYPSLNLRHPGVIRVAQLALPVIFGLGMPQIDVMVNKWFATFVSASAPAGLNYANRLMQVPLGIFAQAAGTAILPMLAAYAAKNAFDDMRSGVSYGLRAIMVESLPATVFMVVMADPLVRTIYMSGEFKPSSVAPVAILMIWYSVGIFAWAGQRIIAPGFFAMQDTITPVAIGTASAIVFIPLNLILMRAMGAPGIALATTIGISLHFFGMTWWLRRRLHGLEGGKVLRTVGRTLVAAAAMGVVCYGVRLGMSRAVGSWQFQDGDFSNPSMLAVRLQQDHTPLSDYLYAGVSSPTRRMIDDDREAAHMLPGVRAALVSELNGLLDDRALYDAKRFARVDLSRELRGMIAAHPAGNQLQEMNRLLIEAAYLDSITRQGGGTWIVRLIAGQNDSANAGGNPRLLHEADVTDVAALSAEILSSRNPVSAYISRNLPGGFVRRLSTFVELSKASTDMPRSLMHDLNKVISGGLVYDSERFQGVNLSARTLALARQNPSGKRLAGLNRRLLEEVFPKEIVARPAARVESRMGSALTVLVAMMLGGALFFGLLRLMKVDEMDYLWSALRRKLTRRRPADAEDRAESPPVDIGDAPD
jgi:putative peptidoglycan lipid II flippase